MIRGAIGLAGFCLVALCPLGCGDGGQPAASGVGGASQASGPPAPEGCGEHHGGRTRVCVDPADGPAALYAALYPDGTPAVETDIVLLPTPEPGMPHRLVPGLGPFDGRVVVTHGSRLLGGQWNLPGPGGSPLLDGPVNPDGAWPRPIVGGQATLLDASGLPLAEFEFEFGAISAFGAAELRGFEVECRTSCPPGVQDLPPEERWCSPGEIVQIGVCVDLAGTRIVVSDVNSGGSYEAFRLQPGPDLEGNIVIRNSTAIDASFGFFVIVAASGFLDGASLDLAIANSAGLSKGAGALQVWPPTAGSTATVHTANNVFAVPACLDCNDSVRVMGGRDLFGWTAADHNHVSWRSQHDTFVNRKPALFGGVGLGPGGSASDNHLDAVLVNPSFEHIEDVPGDGRLDILIGGALVFGDFEGAGFGGTAEGNIASVAVFGARPAVGLCHDGLIDPSQDLPTGISADNRVTRWGAKAWRDAPTVAPWWCRD